MLNNQDIKGDGGQVKKILKHLGLWERKTRPPPKAALPENTIKKSFLKKGILIKYIKQNSKASQNNH
jgi:hypothetical protein